MTKVRYSELVCFVWCMYVVYYVYDIHGLHHSFSGHDGEGQLLRCHKPQEDPRRLPRQDQGTEGSPR